MIASREILRRVLEQRLARGEHIDAPHGPTSARISDSDPMPRKAWDPLAGAALRTLAATLTRLTFGERAGEPTLLRREALDDDQRAVLALTADHGIAVPVRGAPWLTPESMKRFLAGGGPLDRELSIDGQAATIAMHLHRPGNDYAGDVARAERVARALSPDACFDVLEDILAGSYAVGSHTMIGSAAIGCFLARLEPHLESLAPRFDAYAARLRASPADLSGDRARLAMFPFEHARATPPEAWDVLVAYSLAVEPKAGRAWLAAFSPERQARIATWLGNPYLLQVLAPSCSDDELERAIVERFLDPSCTWYVHDATTVVGRVKSVWRLVAARGRATGRRRKVLDDVIRERTRQGHYTVHLSVVRGAIRAVLRDGKERELHRASIPRAPRVPDLEPFVALLDDRKGAVVALAGKLDATTRYAIQRHLAELGVGQTRDGGSTLYRS